MWACEAPEEVEVGRRWSNDGEIMATSPLRVGLHTTTFYFFHFLLCFLLTKLSKLFQVNW